ncbi:MAG: hypothetical protein INR70_31725 [Parafilimonas terrae]|nr:hypothetical protein [Parafilimonas terrae]
MSRHPRGRRIAFDRIASSARNSADAIVTRWLPDGRREGREWVARNPKRADSRPGSFKVNLSTGRWGDFATGDKGGDLIALAAFLFDLKQDEAARSVAEMVGVDAYE